MSTSRIRDVYEQGASITALNVPNVFNRCPYTKPLVMICLLPKEIAGLTKCTKVVRSVSKFEVLY
jgi:hypothetical protein